MLKRIKEVHDKIEDDLEQEIKRLKEAERYYQKMISALTEAKREYHKAEIKCYLRPHEEPEKIPEPPAPAAAPAESGKIPDGPFVNWIDVLDKIKIYDIPLFGIMANTTASIKNGRVVISSDNPTLFDFICTDTHSKELARAVYEVMGRRMKIAVSNPEKAKAEKSPLEDLKNKINKFNNN